MSILPPTDNVVALLSLAEGFRTSQPPDIRSCCQCLLAVLNLNNVYPLILGKTHLQLGYLIMNNTSNHEIAFKQFESAVSSLFYSLLFKYN